MPRVFDDWNHNVDVFCEDAATRWMAEQEKNLHKIRRENSEDALTWQSFRTLEEHGLISKRPSDYLGVKDDFNVFYWQRSATDPKSITTSVLVLPILSRFTENANASTPKRT